MSEEIIDSLRGAGTFF